MAPTGVGKSMALVNIAHGAISQGLNVVYYTLELSESQVGVRMDARVCDIPMEQVYKTPNVVGRRLEQIRGDYGNLIIKQFPTKGASVTSIKAHISRLRTSKFSPDLIIVDYADLLKPISRFKEKRHELESLYEDLRGFAVEFKIPVWTASQSNRQSMDREIVTLSDISESFAKAQVADIILTLQRSASDKKENKGMIFVAKNRAGRDGITLSAIVDTSTAYIETLPEEEGWLDEEQSMDNFKKNEELDKKERIRRLL